MIVRGDLLREQVKEEIVVRILDGRLPALSRINESSLSVDLGVSRTPLREALLSLEQDGFVAAQPGRGFNVAALSDQEIRGLYPIVGALEALGLRDSEMLPEVEPLRAVNDELSAHLDDPRRTKELDDEFHRLLMAGCGNERLLDMIAGLKRIMGRYEAAYMHQPASDGAPAPVMASADEHRTILAALERGDRLEVAAAIEANWRNGMERLLLILADAKREDA